MVVGENLKFPLAANFLALTAVMMLSVHGFAMLSIHYNVDDWAQLEVQSWGSLGRLGQDVVYFLFMGQTLSHYIQFVGAYFSLLISAFVFLPPAYRETAWLPVFFCLPYHSLIG